MEKKAQIRLQKLDFLLKQTDKLHLRDAAEILNVSEMTLRRDLTGENLPVILLGGYVVRNPQYNYVYRYQIVEHQNKNISEKMRVGKLAADLIKAGDVVFFDCGSTIPFIASNINPALKFTALCCSINTFMLLQDKPNCELILCGGRYSPTNSIFTPLTNLTELDAFCCNKAFISAAGIDRRLGATCFDLSEAKIKQKAMAKSKESILVVDHSKINQIQHAYIADLEQFNLVVCDQSLPDSFLDIPQRF